MTSSRNGDTNRTVGNVKINQRLFRVKENVTYHKSWWWCFPALKLLHLWVGRCSRISRNKKSSFCKNENVPSCCFLTAMVIWNSKRPTRVTVICEKDNSFKSILAVLMGYIFRFTSLLKYMLLECSAVYIFINMTLLWFCSETKK